MLQEIQKKVNNNLSIFNLDLTHDVDNLITKASSNQGKVKYLLDELQSVMKGPDLNNPNTPILQTNPAPNAELRIRQNLYGSLIKQFEDSCSKYQVVQSEIKNIIQTKLVRSAEIALNKRLDPEERQAIIENPDQVQQIYADKLTGQAHITLVNAVRDMEERHKEILKLERVIFKLNKEC